MIYITIQHKINKRQDKVGYNFVKKQQAPTNKEELDCFIRKYLGHETDGI